MRKLSPARPAPSKTVSAVRDISIEAWIESFDVKWDLTPIPIGEIDTDKSHSNQARITPLDDDVVQRYALAAEAGAVFPAIVVRRVGKGFVVLDGNHRVAMASLIGDATVGAYVVECTATVGVLMAASANSVNGERNSLEEQRQHVLHLLNMNQNQSQIAVRLGVPKGFVSKCARVAKVRDRCDNLKALSKLSDTSIEVLGRISSTVVMNDAISAAASLSLQGSAVTELVASIDRDADEATQIAQVKAYAESVKSKKSGLLKRKKGLDDLGKLDRSLGSILNVDPVAVGLLANGNAENLKQKINEVAEKLPAILKAL
jgi:ParB-like chromosome segregation protein Spo0J